MERALSAVSATHRAQRMGSMVAVLVLGCSLLLGTAQGAAPPNDRFSNRITLPFHSGTTNGTNTGASKENGEPVHAGNSGGRSVWWRWTAPSDGEVLITTDGSALDSLLAVYTGSSVSSLSPVASNDDHSVFVTSRVRFPVLAGIDYQIAVDGFNDAGDVSTGVIQLALAFTNGFSRPYNDSFALREAIAGAPLTILGTNVHASRELNEPLHAGVFGDTSVWWEWTAPAAGAYEVTTAGSDFDTVLSLYSGADLQSLSVLAANDDAAPESGIQTSRVRFQARAGTAYAIVVDGFDGAAGAIQLEILPADVRLRDAGWNPDGSFRVVASALPGQKISLQTSTNLILWTQVAELTLTNGAAVYVDSLATNSWRKFYRAELLP